jgi:hypothetical protein
MSRKVMTLKSDFWQNKMYTEKIRVLIPARMFSEDRMDLVKRTFKVEDKLYEGVVRRLPVRGKQLFHEIIIDNQSKVRHIGIRLSDAYAISISTFKEMSTWTIEEEAVKSIDNISEVVRMADPYFIGECHG